MDTSSRIAHDGGNAQRPWDFGHSVEVEREVLSAGCRLKQIVCSRLLGEISQRQFDLQRTELLQQIRLLTL